MTLLVGAKGLRQHVSMLILGGYKLRDIDLFCDRFAFLHSEDKDGATRRDQDAR